MILPLFDALAHPTVTGTWLNQRQGLMFEQVDREMQNHNYVGCCAVGLPRQDGYCHASFIEEARKYETMIPIAAFDFGVSDKAKEMDKIHALGFQGIKIHPRLSDFCLQNDWDILVDVCTLAADKKLNVFVCTYCHREWERYPDYDPLRMLVKLLKAVSHVRMVLVHGGDVRVLEYMELVRFNDNVLLDLSLTLCKYEGSSIDLDLKFLFHHFDRRICIGTDSPEYSYHKVRQRFEYLARGVDSVKLENIAYRNVMSFLKGER